MAMLVITRGYLKIMQGFSFCNDPKSHDGITAHYQPLGRCRVAGAVAIFAGESSGPCSTLISVSSSQNFRTCIEPADVDQEISRDIKRYQEISRDIKRYQEISRDIKRYQESKPSNQCETSKLTVLSRIFWPVYAMVHGTWYLVHGRFGRWIDHHSPILEGLGSWLHDKKDSQIVESFQFATEIEKCKPQKR